MPINPRTPSGSNVTVITTTLAVAGAGSHTSSGYPKSRRRKAASTALRVSSIPPSSFPESV
jgi:hypothetical protein